MTVGITLGVLILFVIVGVISYKFYVDRKIVSNNTVDNNEEVFSNISNIYNQSSHFEWFNHNSDFDVGNQGMRESGYFDGGNRASFAKERPISYNKSSESQSM